MFIGSSLANRARCSDAGGRHHHRHLQLKSRSRQRP